MIQDQLNYKQVTISDLQKHMDIKTVKNFLEKTQIIPQIVRFRKDNHQILLEFNSQANAQQFIQQHNHRTKILARKFNIYYSFFDSAENSNKFQRLYVNGITETKLRSAFELCSKYGSCRFKLTYENNKLSFNCIIQFLNFKVQQSLQGLRQAFQELELKLRRDQMFGNVDQFRCSIEIVNFLPVQGLSLSLEQEESISLKLKALIREISENEVQAIQLHKYMHQQQPRVKAYFRFKTAELTLSQFQKIRKHFLHEPQILTKLFYFSDDANNFYTLFTVNLINLEDLSQKQFENKLLQAFRKINPYITQIIVKKHFKNYTGKIYMVDEQSGKDLLASYQKNRPHIYQFYKANSVIAIDIFQNNREQKKQEKYQSNANKMIKHLNSHKGKDRPFGYGPQLAILQLQNHYQHQVRQRNQNYQRPQRKVQYAEKKDKRQEKQKEQPQKVYKPRFKQKIEFNEDDFPSI